MRQAQEPIPAVGEAYDVATDFRRVAKLQGASKEFYVYEGLDRVAALTATGAVKEAYLFDGIDHPLRIARPGASTNYYYYEVDLAGNVRGLRASGGASLGGYRYSAFGQTVEDTTLITQPLRWKGRWFSPVAGGTYDVRARQWSPELGVFLTVDEFGSVGEASMAFDPFGDSGPLRTDLLTVFKPSGSAVNGRQSGFGYHDIRVAPSAAADAADFLADLDAEAGEEGQPGPEVPPSTTGRRRGTLR